MRQQSTFLMTHLASWGFVVAAPDHLGNTFDDMIRLESDEARREAHLRARRQRPGDLHAVLRALLDEGAGENLLPPLDPTRVGVLGHSFGGWTALKLPAREPRVGAVCALAPASEPFIGRRAFEAGELPLPDRVATLLLAARDDVLVDLETSIAPLHERLGRRARLEVIDAADHFHFCDGLELLHELHENTPRPNLRKSVRPGGELLREAEMHGLLNERVTRFFRDALADDDSRSRS
jgi:predicted dienelactone hydrolase